MKLMSYLNHHQLLNQKQSVFKSGHSTEFVLLHMTDTWLQAINDGNVVGCVLVDFRKAFDLIDQKLLLQKLKHYQINKSLSCFELYLSHRTQQANINTNQGSILGPLLFLIFINELPLFIGDSIRSVDLYADDTTLYDIGLDKDMLENNLQHSLNLLKNSK